MIIDCLLFQKIQIAPKIEKELTLCPELGVFVDKSGNYYDADGLSISDPEAIVNADSDFLKITEVFSLTEDGEPVPKKQHTISSQDQPTGSEKDKNVFRIRVIPEAKNNFEEPSSVQQEPKTDLMEARVHKMIKARRVATTSHKSAKEETKKKPEVLLDSKPPVLNIPEVSKQSVAPVLPIIVDVRSECNSFELCSPLISSDSHPENVRPTTQEKNIVKEEPMEHESNDDEETLTGSESNSNLDSIQGIIDNVPEDTYVDVPEFVHISNFSLKDLDDLRKKQTKHGDTSHVQFPQFSPSSGSTLVPKKLVRLLPKPESGSPSLIPSGKYIYNFIIFLYPI